MAKDTTKKSANGNVLINFPKSIIKEVKKISWPKKKDVKKGTIVVLSFTIFFSILIGAIDFGLNNLYTIVFK